MKITRVLIAAYQLSEIFPDDITYLKLDIEDKSEENISEYFQISFDFISSCPKGENILVHCKSGVSRSATIVTAYLIQKYCLTAYDAY